jgi:hypothetical protein
LKAEAEARGQLEDLRPRAEQVFEVQVQVWGLGNRRAQWGAWSNWLMVPACKTMQGFRLSGSQRV